MLVFCTKIFSRNKYTSQTWIGKNFFRKLKSPTRPDQVIYYGTERNQR